MVAKSKNPNYRQVLAYIPKDLVIAFRLKLTAEEREQSEVMEELIRSWVNSANSDK